MVTVAIFAGTLLPGDQFSNISVFEYDKLAHFLMFAAWTFLYGVVRAIRKGTPPNLISVFLFGLFYGIIIEALQFMLPTNRSPELYDFIADAIGSFAAVLLLKPVFISWFSKDDQLHDNVI